MLTPLLQGHYELSTEGLWMDLFSGLKEAELKCRVSQHQYYCRRGPHGSLLRGEESGRGHFRILRDSILGL